MKYKFFATQPCATAVTKVVKTEIKGPTASSRRLSMIRFQTAYDKALEELNARLKEISKAVFLTEEDSKDVVKLQDFNSKIVELFEEDVAFDKKLDYSLITEDYSLSADDERLLLPLFSNLPEEQKELLPDELKGQ